MTVNFTSQLRECRQYTADGWMIDEVSDCREWFCRNSGPAAANHAAQASDT